MLRPFISSLLLGVTFLVAQAAVRADEPDTSVGDRQPDGDTQAPGCFGQRSFHEVWIKVAERTCLKCHVEDGDASESDFLLRDVSRIPLAERAQAVTRNCDALTRVAGDSRRRRTLTAARQSHRWARSRRW